MNIGMLWRDDDNGSTLEQKVQRAADYYRKKYGTAPDTCLVNIAMVPAETRVGRIRVQPTRAVLPNHFWVGVQS
jgi:hypothetical protein